MYEFVSLPAGQPSESERERGPPSVSRCSADQCRAYCIVSLPRIQTLFLVRGAEGYFGPRREGLKLCIHPSAAFMGMGAMFVLGALWYPLSAGAGGGSRSPKIAISPPGRIPANYVFPEGDSPLRAVIVEIFVRNESGAYRTSRG